MSASERLIAARDAVEGQMADDGDGHLVDELLDAYAHELAEKIREHAGSDGLDYYSPQGLYEAADLIDPEPDRE